MAQVLPHAHCQPNKACASGGKDRSQYIYFDEELYKRRTKIEHANVRMDAFNALLARFETKISTWQFLVDK